MHTPDSTLVTPVYAVKIDEKCVAEVKTAMTITPIALARTVRSTLATVIVALSQGLLPPSSGPVQLPPLPPMGALVVCTDISASVPLSVASSAQRFVTRDLSVTFGHPGAQGSSGALFVWDKIGADSYSPSAVLVRAVLPPVHPRPENPFLQAAARARVLAVEDAERRAAAAATAAAARRVMALRFRQEPATDLPGCFDRFALDTSYLQGHRTLLVISDLIGNAPGSSGAPLDLRRADVVIFQYCSSRWIDSARACAGRHATWQGVLDHLGAAVHWYSSDNLDTLDHL